MYEKLGWILYHLCQRVSQVVNTKGTFSEDVWSVLPINHHQQQKQPVLGKRSHQLKSLIYVILLG